MDYVIIGLLAAVLLLQLLVLFRQSQDSKDAQEREEEQAGELAEQFTHSLGLLRSAYRQPAADAGGDS